MNGFIQDLRFALRSFALNPGFTAAALLSIAIGVGANSSIFSVASALLLRPLPYPDADRLAILWSRSPGLGIAEDWFSTAQYFDIKRGHQGFEEVAIAIGGNYNLTGDGNPERIGTVRVSSNLLPMLGARPALGRLFTADDDVPGGAGVAVLNHGTWMRRYGGDPGVVGRSVTLNGQKFQIAGVLAPSFSLPREVLPTLGGAENAEILLHLPLAADAATARNREDYNVVAKLKRGVGFAEARARMETITARLRREHPDYYPANGGLTFDIVPLQEQVVGDVRRSLLILVAAVGFVLLVACANVANLQLSRALSRRREIAVRAALGASRGRIVRQLLTESVLLAAAGGALGLVLAVWSLEGIRALGSRSVPRLGEIAVNGEVLLFTLAVSVASGVLFGLMPALRVCRLDLHDNLKDASRGSTASGAIWSSAGRGRNGRQFLVVAELALSVMLLIGAGLLIRSFARVQQVPAGFNAANLLTLELTMSGAKYNESTAVLETYRQLWERLTRLPGAVAAGGVSALPLSQMFAWGPITVEGRPLAPGEAFINVDQRVVAGDYFRAMEIPLLNGRLFSEQDNRTQPRVVVIDDAMARQLWPNEDAIGKRIRLGGIDANPEAPWVTIVGIVGRVKQYTLDGDSRIAMYFPQTQVVGRGMNVVVRTEGDPAALTTAARAEVRSLDPDLPIYNVRTMSQRVAESLARRRFSMLLLTLFAALALGLAAIGIYGVIAYLVAQGTRELGIRMALGATPHAVLLMIIRHGLAVALLGVGIGLAGAFALTRFMSSQLFGVAAGDPATFLAVSLLLTLVALAASYIPARRAAAIDVMVSLRSE
jgi:putative ABC transport system permease protein